MLFIWLFTVYQCLTGRLYLQTAVLRCFIVSAVQKKKLHRVQELFQLEGSRLLSEDNAATWALWYGLPYFKEPQQDHRLQARITGRAALLVVSCKLPSAQRQLKVLPLPKNCRCA